MDTLGKSVSKPLRDIIRRYKHQLPILHPFEATLADLTVRAREKTGERTLQVGPLTASSPVFLLPASLVLVAPFFFEYLLGVFFRTGRDRYGSPLRLFVKSFAAQRIWRKGLETHP